jgi:hypothetical protein
MCKGHYQYVQLELIYEIKAHNLLCYLILTLFEDECKICLYKSHLFSRKMTLEYEKGKT